MKLSIIICFSFLALNLLIGQEVYYTLYYGHNKAVHYRSLEELEARLGEADTHRWAIVKREYHPRILYIVAFKKETQPITSIRIFTSKDAAISEAHRINQTGEAHMILPNGDVVKDIQRAHPLKTLQFIDPN